MGVDPADFSMSLAKHCKSYVEQQHADIESPLSILEAGYQQTKHIIGSTTACIVLFDARKRLMKVANLGDSGTMLYRNNNIVYQTTPLQHSFNCPFQLSCSKVSSSDLPHDATVDQFALKTGDIILLYTDGFSDNVSVTDTRSIIKQHCEEVKLHSQQHLLSNLNLDDNHDKTQSHDLDEQKEDNSIQSTSTTASSSLTNTSPSESPVSSQSPSHSHSYSNPHLNDTQLQSLADKLASHAFLISQDKSAKNTPFAESCKQHGYRYHGGKADDVTCIVAQYTTTGLVRSHPDTLKQR